MLGSADAQRAVNVAVAPDAGISVQSQRKLKRHTASEGIGEERAAARERVEVVRARAQVVAVVTRALLCVEKRVGKTCPLSVIACRLKGTRHAACAKSLAVGLTHAAAKAHRVGSHRALMSAVSGEDYAIVLIKTFVKLKRAEIHPRAAAHALIDAELRAAPFVTDRIKRIGNAIGKTQITDINGIASRLAETGYPHGRRLVAQMVCCLGIAHRASAKKARAIGEQAAAETEAHAVGKGVPRRCAAVGLGINAPAVAAVVVHDDLRVLEIALHRAADNGTRILEHRK